MLIRTLANKYAFFKILSFILRLKDEFYVRELSRKLNLSVSVVKYWVDVLYAHKIVEKRKLGRVYLYKVRHDFYLTKAIKRFFSLAEIQHSGLVEELVKLFDSNLISITLYGSVAKGEDDEKSDIDILVLVKRKIKFKKELRAEKKLLRELSLLIRSRAEWIELSKRNPAFYYNVVLNGVSLYGELPVVR